MHVQMVDTSNAQNQCTEPKVRFAVHVLHLCVPEGPSVSHGLQGLQTEALEWWLHLHTRMACTYVNLSGLPGQQRVHDQRQVKKITCRSVIALPFLDWF